VALVVAPFGCQTVTLDGGDLSSLSKFGFAINKDVASELLMTLEGDDGTTIFVFGRRSTAGGIASVGAITAKSPGGEESFITFESGRPAHVQASDGSYAHITYAELSPERLAADVDLYSAGDGSTQSIPVEIDLTQALEDLAAVFEETTGQELAVVDAEAVEAGAKSVGGAAQSVLLVPVIVVPFTTLVSFTSLILSQVFVFVFKVVVGAMASIMVALMYPFLVLAELTHTALFLPVVFVDMLIYFDELPSVPVYVLR
jgi:hypothetical protein